MDRKLIMPEVSIRPSGITTSPWNTSQKAHSLAYVLAFRDSVYNPPISDPQVQTLLADLI